MYNKISSKIIIIIILACSSIAAQEYKIGEEYVLPLKYPKFSISGNYDIGRHFQGLADRHLHFKLANQFGASLAFEAGLYQYFNAGAQLTFNTPITPGVPIQLRLALFAKPYFPLNDRCSIFARLGGGISAAQGNMKSWLSTNSSHAARELERVYGNQNFFGTAFGGNIFTTLGIEYFPWPLFGFALEGGFRGEIWRERGSQISENIPNNLDYITYEFPLTVLIHIIL